LKIIGVFLALVCCGTALFSAPMDRETELDIEKRVTEAMVNGKIPGLTLVIVTEDGNEYIKGFGVADQEKDTAIDAGTLFELGSCSKSFTALAVLKLEGEGLLNLDDPVAKFYPWFRTFYKNEKNDITIRHLLHHTSGLPWKSVDLIPAGSDKDALQKTLRNINNYKLTHKPGDFFEYATVNYALLGAVIEKATGLAYEKYMTNEIFLPLGMEQTYVGVPAEGKPMSVGHKIGFFKPRKYEPPLFRGNYPAGYIISNGTDMARWLKIQAGIIDVGEEWRSYILKSQQQDRNVSLDEKSLSAYAMGWQVYLDGSGLIAHSGANPNFTSWMGFHPEEKVAVAVLANSNSGSTPFIAKQIMNIARGKPIKNPFIPTSSLDKPASLVSIMAAAYIIFALLFLLSIFIDLIFKRRSFQKITGLTASKLFFNALIYVPILIGVSFLPRAIADVSWKTAMVWAPSSLNAAAYLLVGAMGATYLGSLFSMLFPLKNKYLRSLPMIIILSFISGGCNAIVLFLITSSLFSDITLFYQLYYFALAFFIYIFGRKILQTKLIKLTFDIVYDMRLTLIEKIFLTSFQKFEKIDRGRVYATLNDDTGQIGNSANLIVQLITSIITTIGVFTYLATIAFWATMLTIGVIAAIATLYSVVSRKTRVYFEEARDTRNVYMRLLNGMIDGFKELSLQYKKRLEYKDDIEASCDEFRNKISLALIKFINAFLIGETLLIAVLGAVGFAIPRLFPNISTFTLMSFIMALLYLIGPVNGILNSIPAIMRLRVSIDRVRQFIKDIPANMNPDDAVLMKPDERQVDSIVVKDVTFEYENEKEEDKFSVGPVNLEFNKGEITFIIGGNGSGKTTLAKILTGLYNPDEGSIAINGGQNANGQLGEYYSVVFDDFHLFGKIYNVNLSEKEDVVEKYLDVLRLRSKVKVEDNAFHTIDLSGGQKKRLALMQCYLEDSPVYLFDEVAADQDPEFRRFFYRELLQKMKEDGKIVIAITHDDHYFDVADKIIKMDMGQIEKVDKNFRTTAE
jgi:cyclic peptide transporter